MKLRSSFVSAIAIICVNSAGAQTASDVFPNIPYTSTTRLKLSLAAGAKNTGKIATQIVIDGGGCGGYFEDYCTTTADTYSGGGWSVLESIDTVVIYGSSVRDTSICYEDECRQYLRAPDEVVQLSPAWLQEKIIEKTVSQGQADACTTVKSGLASPEQQDILQRATSLNEADDRQVAARAAIQASGLASKFYGQFTTSGIGLSGMIHKWAYRVNNGYTATIVFSDGGSEQYKWVLLNDGPHNPTVIPGTLKKSNGVSRCPK